ncbi:double zinc ribbon domain-containing protein [Arhodomonas sp. SL1]|uniref:double zinc ribbon domain-containing protein n=1 Tax=Arhodomonas sp. SL1 TaxID=3425691 RepID=UPI003F88191A
MDRNGILGRVGGRLAATLLAPRCRLCGEPPEQDPELCAACRRSLPWLERPCRRCGLPLRAWERDTCDGCRRAPPPWATLVAPFAYSEPVSGMIHAFKHHGDLAAGRLLADFLALCLPAWSDAELLPVPLARRRLRERGFNQASEIARHLGLPVRHGCLQRVSEGPHQQDLGAAERQRNVRGRFALRRPPPAGAVIIVDDVVTTGATVTALARLLRQAGAGPIGVCALARTLPAGPGPAP